ncbi:MAG: MarR family winged helix-turn-helix transcriptional regulator [Vicinamibacterales bacterium]
MVAQASRGTRAELLQKLDETLRKVGAQSVLLSDTVAKLVRLNSTDLECLDLLYLAGATTAGRLAQHTGLTTGATTAVIDRLERAGLVRRHRDPEDRRCVRVEAQPGCLRHIEPLYRRLAHATSRLNQDYDDRQLAVVVDYLSRAVELCAEHVTWLQTHPPVSRDRASARRSSRATGHRHARPKQTRPKQTRSKGTSRPTSLPMARRS